MNGCPGVSAQADSLRALPMDPASSLLRDDFVPFCSLLLPGIPQPHSVAANHGTLFVYTAYALVFMLPVMPTSVVRVM
jgi:hypothetical protein